MQQFSVDGGFAVSENKYKNAKGLSNQILLQDHDQKQKNIVRYEFQSKTACEVKHRKYFYIF